MKRLFAKLFVIAALLAPTSIAHAEDCTFSKPADEMSETESDALYACVEGKLKTAYGKAGHDVGATYRNWKNASIRPAAPGVHSERFLMTFVNEIGYDAYTEFKDEGVKLPAGTVIAKESYTANKKGKLAIGPLLIMVKLKEGQAEKYGDWKYVGVGTNGKEFKVSQDFCHACHVAFETQDYVGYPVEEVRVIK